MPVYHTAQRQISEVFNRNNTESLRSHIEIKMMSNETRNKWSLPASSDRTEENHRYRCFSLKQLKWCFITLLISWAI
jgi:hypothetical protein